MRQCKSFEPVIIAHLRAAVVARRIYFFRLWCSRAASFSFFFVLFFFVFSFVSFFFLFSFLLDLQHYAHDDDSGRRRRTRKWRRRKDDDTCVCMSWQVVLLHNHLPQLSLGCASGAANERQIQAAAQ
jgi:hypothetical protein